MSAVSKSRTWRLGLMVVVAVISSPEAALAVVPVPYPPPFLTPVLINGTAGDQNDPHVSGDWASYASDNSIRYFRFSTGIDTRESRSVLRPGICSPTSAAAGSFSPA